MRNFLLPALCLSMALPAFAEESGDKEEKYWSGSQDLGYIKKDGNTESEELHAAFRLVYDKHPYRNTFKVEASNSSAEDATGQDIRSAEKYFISDKVDYFLTERSYILSQLKYDDDHFSGFDYQSTWTFGYGYQVVQRDDLSVELEAGPGYYHDRRDDGKHLEGSLIRLAEALEWKINNTSTLGQELSYEANSDNKKTDFSIYVQTQLQDSLALKVTQKVKINDTDERQPGITKADRELIVSMVYTF